jgi:hypothetical protein
MGKEKPCHSEQGEAASRNLGTDFTAKRNEMRRSLDSLTLPRDDNFVGIFNCKATENKEKFCQFLTLTLRQSCAKIYY